MKRRRSSARACRDCQANPNAAAPTDPAPTPCRHVHAPPPHPPGEGRGLNKYSGEKTFVSIPPSLAGRGSNHAMERRLKRPPPRAPSTALKMKLFPTALLAVSAQAAGSIVDIAIATLDLFTLVGAGQAGGDALLAGPLHRRRPHQ